MRKAIGFFMVVFLLCSIIFLASFLFYKKLSQVFVSADSASSYQSDFPSFSYVVVDDFKSDPVQLKRVDLVILDKQSSKVLIFEVPLNAKVSVPGKFSTSDLSEVFALGGLNSEDRLTGGLDLVNRTLFNLFGFKVDNYVLVDSSISSKIDQLIYEGDDMPFPFSLTEYNLNEIKASLKTDFCMNCFYQVYNFVTSLPSDRHVKTEIDLNSVNDPLTIDKYFYDLTLSSKVSAEKKNISVLNGTDYDGAAFLGSRVVKNMGGRVVAISSTQKDYQESILIVDDKTSETAKFLKNAFHINKVLSKEEAGDIQEQEVYRSDITLILGFDLARYLY